MKKKKLLTILILALVCLAVICAFFSLHVLLPGQVVSVFASEVTLEDAPLPGVQKLRRLDDLQRLDARQVSMDAQQYEHLKTALPNCDILWNVPAFGGYFENTCTQIVAASVTEEDLASLKYFESLTAVDATACTDLDVIMKLKAAYPALVVPYHVPLESLLINHETEELTFTGDDATQLLAAIPYLAKLKTIDATNCSDYETLTHIRQTYPDIEISYNIPAGGQVWPYDATALTLNNIDGNELQTVLPHFTALETVTLTGIAPDNDTMYALVCAYPEVIFHWEFEVCGVATSSTATELILSDIPMETVDAVETSLKYFYDLQRVEMCQCGISNEEMDALCQRYPEIRFVWSLLIGKDYLRTDATAFIPYHYGYHFDNPCGDEVLSQLKYCVDLICIDLGHMTMTDISFLANMPNLQYLVLADALAEDYSAIGQLTELVYLELFNSKFTDTTLLLNLTKLEDLNVAWVNLDEPELLMEMTWLKRLWATHVGLSDEQNRELKAALTDTVVCINGKHPTDLGWRQAQRYYEMRDLLGMRYMQ